MNHLQQALGRLPFSMSNVVVILSGGLDSTATLRLAVHHYGAHRVRALSFDYGQKQRRELYLAHQTCEALGVSHKVLDLGFLGEINQGFSANVDANIAMPTIQDVLGDPAPVTYVANRNMIMLSIAAAFAEARDCDTILAGFQSNDTYGYHDTTPEFTKRVNDVLELNRKTSILIACPFNDLTKEAEIRAVFELDGNIDLFRNTLTCYNPSGERSCGKCPSCAERLAAFRHVGMPDPIPYL